MTCLVSPTGAGKTIVGPRANVRLVCLPSTPLAIHVAPVNEGIGSGTQILAILPMTLCTVVHHPWGTPWLIAVIDRFVDIMAGGSQIRGRLGINDAIAV